MARKRILNQRLILASVNINLSFWPIFYTLLAKVLKPKEATIPVFQFYHYAVGIEQLNIAILFFFLLFPFLFFYSEASCVIQAFLGFLQRLSMAVIKLPRIWSKNKQPVTLGMIAQKCYWQNMVRKQLPLFGQSEKKTLRESVSQAQPGCSAALLRSVTCL